MTRLWGWRIYLQDEYTENTAIGLYTAASVSRFRWIEASCDGTTETWKAGIIADKGLGAIKESVDISVGGNVANLSNTEILIDDTAMFWKTIDDGAIALNGCRAELVEFLRDDTLGTTTETVLYYGEVSIDAWDINTYSIPVKPMLYKRDANIATQINATDFPDAEGDVIGKTVPVTFGKFDQDSMYAKFIRTANAIDKWENDGSFAFGIYSILTADPSGTIDAFPVVGDDGTAHAPIMYKIKIGNTVAWWDGLNPASGDITVTELNGYYLSVIEGTGEGQFRRIESVISRAADRTVLEVTLATYAETRLVGNATATEVEQSWVNILDISRVYSADEWPCDSFLDTAGADITKNYNLFSYDSDKKADVKLENTEAQVFENQFDFLRLPSFGLTTAAGDTDKNSLIVALDQHNGDIDKMDSFLVLPLKSIELSKYTDAEMLSKWGLSTIKLDDGFYSNQDIGTPSGSLVLDSGQLSNVLNNTYSSIARYTESGYSPGSINGTPLFAFKFTPPDYPDYFKFDKVYLGVSFESGANNAQNIYLGWFYRRWIGPRVDDSFIRVSNTTHAARIENMPIEYFTITPSNKNLYLNVMLDDQLINTTEYVYCGINSDGFELDMADKNVYESYFEHILLLFYATNVYSSPLATIRALGYIFKKSLSIKDAVYSPFSGRIYNSTWGTRKTAADVIESPVDIMEHVCRLQNWEELEATEQPGKAYGTGALINTASFDSADLSTLQSTAIAWQIFEHRDAQISNIKRELCRTFFVVNYVDEDGKECLMNIFPSGIAITDTITMADMVEGSDIGEVKEPDVKDVFCEPFIRYQYNTASGGYNAIASITNIQAAAWQASYTPGLSAGDGETLWNLCKANYTKYKHIEAAPVDMTDKKMIKDATTAAQYLNQWIQWMTKRTISLPIHYNKTGANLWHVGRHVYLNLPHQTAGVDKECIISSISKDKAKGTIALDLVIL